MKEHLTLVDKVEDATEAIKCTWGYCKQRSADASAAFVRQLRTVHRSPRTRLTSLRARNEIRNREENFRVFPRGGCLCQCYSFIFSLEISFGVFFWLMVLVCLWFFSTIVVQPVEQSGWVSDFVMCKRPMRFEWCPLFRERELLCFFCTISQ